MTPPNPSFDVAHLGHVEMFNRDWSSDVCSSDLDYEHASLKLTRHHTTGVGHIAYRAASPTALEIGRASCRERV